MVRHAARQAEERASAQVSLFGEAVGAEAPPPPLPEVDPWNAIDQLAREFEAIGFYLSAHPLDGFAATLRRAGAKPYADVVRGLGSAVQRHIVAGTVLGRQERTSAKGNRFAFVQCSDPTGVFEVAVFSEQLSQHRELLEPGQSLVFHLDAKLQDDQPKLTVERIESLEKVAANTAAGMKIFVNQAQSLDGIKAVLGRAGRGKGHVRLLLPLGQPGREAEVQLRETFAITPQIRAAMKAVRGVVDVHEL